MNNVMLVNLGRQYGGTEKVTEDLLLNGNISRIQFYLVCINGTGLYIKSSSITNKIISLPHAKIFTPIYVLKMAYFAKMYKIDIIHCHGITSSFFGTFIGTILNIPVITTVHGIVDIERDGYIKRKVFKVIENLLSNFNKRYICVSKFVKQNLINRGIIESKLVVIYNSIRDKELKCDIIKNTYFKEGYFKICSIGRLEDIKGHKYLLKAVNYLIKKNCKVQCILAGEGSCYDKLKEYIYDNSLQDYISLIGHINNPNNLIIESDIVVMPSLMETFGIAILETIALGKCVISTNVGGVPEIIKNGENGILVEPCNEISLAEAILKCYNDKLLIKNMELNAKSSYDHNFSNLVMYEEYINLYDEIINSERL
ncbi:Glycosyltransferase involved in cell wall bisynthesis [Clostridium acidisoli DSM 12555]|uniref:Glycosyltransferase involved in cell wall bisynthesis n=1 Tax=Clostridium acidisoli DSM 12555 TaxID=1121291 RepID=A0A1W1XH01_9CLOT|nr:glycosyltransferase family 4 protein [Clostridium acidisoli]SMC23239.1 Glycosyltransferase involved in cell wall bisynthesis [Clostridium acidisoli DSM 12555]